MSAKKRYSYEPDYAVPPGETLSEVMESLGMSQKELAIRTGLTVQSLLRMIKGEQPITYESANRLELATGVPARLWNNLELQYRQQLAKMAERKRMQADLEWLESIPTKELQARGLIGNHKDQVQVLRDTLAFFGVSSVDAWCDVWEAPAVAARRSPCFETCPGRAAAWIRQGELQAQAIACKPYDKGRFLEVLDQVRALTKEKPAVFESEMKRLCAEAGVAVALVREMKKVPWNGATRWLTPHKAMILLSLRGRGEDRFWFSFFHEAGHVLHDSKKDLFINSGEPQNEQEKRADQFAADFLIPRSCDNAIRGFRSKAEVVALADRLKIAPGIVAGRYRFLTNNWDYFSGLIRRLDWRSAQESR